MQNESFIRCTGCGSALTKDEIALHKKLINRGAAEHLCIRCLAAHFSVGVDSLYDKIKQFRLTGCTLFEEDKKPRYLGVDYGDVRTGIAISDETNILANALGCIKEEWAPKLTEKIKEYIVSYDITDVVLGDPVNMNGSRGPRSEKAHALAELIKTVCGVNVILYDERLTTVSAHNYLSESNIRGKKRKETVDKLAAEIILQAFLDSVPKKTL
ncbi:MAG: Holliday junction resolvase RuvX [Clostridia bacterium]|nr:Holliday junction resolvase RuvX [Clostridia bacterium]